MNLQSLIAKNKTKMKATRRDFIKTSNQIAVGVGLMGIAACQENKTIMTNTAKTTFIHTVFFWFNEGVTEEEAKQFEQGLMKLSTCPSIQAFHYGKAAGTPRAVVDNSYNYAWILHFETAKAQDEYQVDPIHQEFVELYKHLWARVQVYDTIVG